MSSTAKSSDSIEALFGDPTQRTAVLNAARMGDHRLTASDPWRQACIATLFADDSLIKADAAIIAVIAIVQADADLANEVSREGILQSETFKRVFRTCRTSADNVVRNTLGHGKNDPWEPFKHAQLPADFDDPRWTDILDTITREAQEEDEEWTRRFGRTVRLLSPAEAGALEQQLLGQTIRFTKTEGTEGSFPALGPKTTGEVLGVTERHIVVEWSDGREFPLVHGRDEYELVR